MAARKLPKDRVRQIEKASRNEKSWELESCSRTGIRKLLRIAEARVSELKERKRTLKSKGECVTFAVTQEAGEILLEQE